MSFGEILYHTVGQLALLVDQERGADDPHVLPAVHGLLRPHPVSLGHGVVLVREQREAQSVLLVELRPVWPGGPD